MSSATALRAPTVDHLGMLLAGQPLLAPSPWAHVNALREQAQTALGALSMPPLRDDAWRFTDLAPLHRLTFQLVLAAQLRLQRGGVCGHGRRQFGHQHAAFKGRTRQLRRINAIDKHQPCHGVVKAERCDGL